MDLTAAPLVLHPHPHSFRDHSAQVQRCTSELPYYEQQDQLSEMTFPLQDTADVEEITQLAGTTATSPPTPDWDLPLQSPQMQDALVHSPPWTNKNASCRYDSVATDLPALMSLCAPVGIATLATTNDRHWVSKMAGAELFFPSKRKESCKLPLELPAQAATCLLPPPPPQPGQQLPRQNQSEQQLSPHHNQQQYQYLNPQQDGQQSLQHSQHVLQPLQQLQQHYLQQLHRRKYHEHLVQQSSADNSTSSQQHPQQVRLSNLPTTRIKPVLATKVCVASAQRRRRKVSPLMAVQQEPALQQSTAVDVLSTRDQRRGTQRRTLPSSSMHNPQGISPESLPTAQFAVHLLLEAHVCQKMEDLEGRTKIGTILIDRDYGVIDYPTGKSNHKRPYSPDMRQVLRFRVEKRALAQDALLGAMTPTFEVTDRIPITLPVSVTAEDGQDWCILEVDYAPVLEQRQQRLRQLRANNDKRQYEQGPKGCLALNWLGGGGHRLAIQFCGASSIDKMQKRFTLRTTGSVQLS